MHEFEALLFSDCDRLGAGIEKPELVPRFQEIRNAFRNPEEIDDSPETAPSKRLKNLVPEYQKVLFGTLGAQAIGLARMRESCPHFDGWLRRLEAYIGE